MLHIAHLEGCQRRRHVGDLFHFEADTDQPLADLIERGGGVEIVLQPGEREFHGCLPYYPLPRAGEGAPRHAERVRGRARALADDRQRLIHGFEHFDILKADHLEAQAPRWAVRCSSDKHLGVGRMCRAIDFDDELLFAAHEIGDVGTGRSLANELVAVERAVAQLLPQPLLGEGFCFAEMARQFGFCAVTHCETPPHLPACRGRPLPLAGEVEGQLPISPAKRERTLRLRSK